MTNPRWLAPLLSAWIATTSGCLNLTPSSPAARFAALETFLLETERFELDYRIQSEGTFAIDVRGVLMVDGPTLEISFQGTFDGHPKRGLFHCDTSRMSLDTGGADFERGPPRAPREGIVLGLTRMGLLHNVAVLAHGGAPDGTDGNAREWIRAANFQADGDAIRFDVYVADEHSAVASLQIDRTTGLPTRRTQTVRFGADSKLVVTEEYRAPSDK